MQIDRLLEIIAIISWGLYVIYLIISLIQHIREKGVRSGFKYLFSHYILIPLLIPITTQIISSSLVFIEPHQSAVVISVLEPRGYKDNPWRSGLHWRWPLLESSIIYPIYWQTYTMAGRTMEGDLQGNDAITARTSDGQEVQMDVSVIFRIDAQQVVQVHVDWQDRYIDELIRPLIRSLVRSRVSAFTVDEVNSQQRQNLESDLNRILSDELAKNGIIVDQILLRNIAFSEEYAAAVESKQVSLQHATQAQYEADRIRILAEGESARLQIEAKGQAAAIITKAEGEAHSIQIKAEAEEYAIQLIRVALANDPGILNYRYIDKIPGNINVMLLPNDTPLILPFPDLNATESQTPESSNLPTTTPSPTPTPTPSPSE